MSAQLKIPCLGRPLKLGTLYDCRSHKIVPGKTLWDSKALQSVTQTKPLPSSSFEVFTGDTFQKKCSGLGIDGDLKLSLLGGMVELGGAAKFFNDKKSSELQARVTLKHSCTTHLEELTTIAMEVGASEQPVVLGDDLATHVVTGVMYGSDAFFVFDRSVDKTDKVGDVEVKMAAQVKCVPTLCEDPSAINKQFDKTETENIAASFIVTRLLLPLRPLSMKPSKFAGSLITAALVVAVFLKLFICIHYQSSLESHSQLFTRYHLIWFF